MDYYLYIIQSQKDNSFYIGSTADPVKRLEKHNLPHKGYTGRKQPWQLVYIEAFTTKTEALIREKYLKKMKSKELLVSLINKG